MKRDRDNHKVQYLNQQRVELESRIDTVLEMLMVQRTPKQKWIISKYNKMRRRYNKLAVSYRYFRISPYPRRNRYRTFGIR